MIYTQKQVDRFWLNVDKRGPDACWLWKLSTNQSGHGQVALTVNGRERLLKAHKVAWEITHNKPIPYGVHGLHTCHNATCCNPRHVVLQGDIFPKSIDYRGKARGQAHGKAKLTDEQVGMIKRMDTLKIREIARLFGVSYHTIWDIKNNITWTHI